MSSIVPVTTSPGAINEIGSQPLLCGKLFWEESEETMLTTIAVLNHSKQVSQADARLMTSACALQLMSFLFLPWECVPFSVFLYLRRSDLPKRSIAIVIFDKADEPDTLGYHTEDDEGRRFGRVFVNPTIDAGGSILGTGDSVSVTLSHEVIEAFIDPDLNLWAEGRRDLMWAYEICDAVESHSYRIKVRKRFVGVSHFLYSTWFDLENPPNTKFDHMHVTTKPFELAPGGSAVTWDGFEVKIKTRKLPKTRKQRKSHKLARTHQRCMQM